MAKPNVRSKSSAHAVPFKTIDPRSAKESGVPVLAAIAQAAQDFRAQGGWQGKSWNANWSGRRT